MGKKKAPKVREIAAPKRIERELELLKEYSYTLPAFRELKADPEYEFRWTFLILPSNEPYKDCAFRIEMILPKDYPFRAPRILFLTKIYHPNVDDLGRVCLAMIAIEHWKPTTRIDQIIQGLVALVNDPDPDDPILPERAKEYVHDYEKFKRVAMHYNRKYAEPLPPDLPPLKKKKGDAKKK